MIPTARCSSSRSVYLLLVSLFYFPALARAQFFAVNDANPGPKTHTNATTFTFVSSTVVSNSPVYALKDIASGTNLPAKIQFSAWSTGASGSSSCCTLSPGTNTTAFQIFSPYVDFPGAGNVTSIDGERQYAFAFSGLNPSREYRLRACVFNNTGFVSTNTWTLIQLTGAVASTRAHSQGCLSKTNFGLLRENQVLINNLVTNKTVIGDVIGWDDIHPAPDGTFSIVEQSYLGPLPNGYSVGQTVPVLSKLILEEVVPGPTTRFTDQPLSQRATEGDLLQISAGILGADVALQWYKDGTMVLGATNALLSFNTCHTNDAGQYFLLASNSAGTVTSSNAFLVVDSREPQVLIGTGAFWRYNAVGVDLGTSWKDSTFDDSAWPEGPAILAFEDDRILAPLIRTTLPLRNEAGTKINTYYFRTHFQFPFSLEGVTLIATNLVDDGAVFYLNGTELFRFHMPDGVIQYTTGASSPAIGNATFLRTNLPPGVLKAGENILAAEVHQNGANSSDVVFGLTLMADYPSPKIHLGRSGQNVSVSWNAFGFQLEGSSDLQGSWLPVPVTNNTAIINPTNAAQFLRLKR